MQVIYNIEKYYIKFIIKKYKKILSKWFLKVLKEIIILKKIFT